MSSFTHSAGTDPHFADPSHTWRDLFAAAIAIAVTWWFADYFHPLAWFFAHVRPGFWLGLLPAIGVATAVHLVRVMRRRSRRSAEREYRAFFEGNPFPMLIYDPATLRIVAANNAACTQYGYPRDRFLTLNVLDLIPPADRARVRAVIDSGGAANGTIWRHVTSSGQEIEVEITAHWIPWRDGNARIVLARDMTEQRRAEALLRRSEEELLLVLESTGEGICSMDLEGVCLSCNPAALRLLGWERSADIVGRDLHAILHRPAPGDQPCAPPTCPLLTAAREGRAFEADDETFGYANGGSFPAEVRSNPILRDGRPVGAVVAFANVTPRKQAERALRASESRLRSLSESGIVGLSVGQHDGRTIEANDAYLRMLGYSRSELAAGEVRWDRTTPSEISAMEQRSIHQIFDGAAVLPWETEMLRKDGGRVPVLVGLVPIEDRSGAISVTVDLTELRRAQASLAASQSRYQQLFERNLAGVFSADLGGHVLEANAAFAHMAGYPARDALIAAGSAGIFSDFTELLAELERESVLTNREIELRRPDGQTLSVLANLSFRPSAAGVAGGIEGTVVDITDYKKLEAQLRHAQKMESVGQLAGGIAHDFNNLLTVISGYCQLLLTKGHLSEADRKRVEQIERAGTRAAGLTRQLLAFSRQQVFELKVLDLNQVLQSATAMLHRVVGEHYALDLRLGAALQPVKADLGQIEQVLMNLVVNARDAMPDGGRILIESANAVLDESFTRLHPGSVPGPYVMFAVTDTGVGMDEVTRSRIFEPFFTTKPAGHGTGLGLATVFGIVKQSGGAIYVYSEPGAGTSVKVYLPVQAGEVAEAAAAPAPAPSAGSETILLVEDEPEVRAFVGEVLTSNGYKVITADGPSQAVDVCRDYAGAIDLLVSDVIMPGMNGPALADDLRRRRRDLKVLFMSGYPSNAIAQSGALDDHAVFLSKPFTPAAIAAKVRSALDAAQGC